MSTDNPAPASTPGASTLSSWFPSSNPAPSAPALPPPDKTTPVTNGDAATNAPKETGAKPVESTPPPTSDKNAAPPPINNPTPETKNDPIPLSTVVSGFVFTILAGIAIYYGWIIGQLQGREYLLYIQSFGSPFRNFFFVYVYPIIQSFFNGLSAMKNTASKSWFPRIF